MAETISAKYQAHVLYAPVAVDDACPFEDGPADTRGIDALLQSKKYRVSRDDEMADRDSGLVDVIVADCRAAEFDLGQASARFTTLRRAHPEGVFLILIEPELGWDARLWLKRFGTLCPIGDRADLVLSRLDRLLDNLALADECGERLKTLSALNRTNVSGGILEASSKPMRVLVAGAPSPVTLRAMKSLNTPEYRVTAAISVPQALRYLELNIFDCLVLLPGERTATYTGLVKMLRRNDRTKSLPILVIPDRATGSDAHAGRFMAQGADTVLCADDSDRGLTTEVTAFARRNRLTTSMKQFLRKAASSDGKGTDVVTDLAFFENHLERQCLRAGEVGKPLCVSAFRLSYGSSRRISPAAFRQALKYVQMMVRDTDLITAVRDDLFLISQPGLSMLEASRKQHNIAEVLQEIILDDPMGPVSEHLTLETSTVQCRAGEMAEGMISRAFKSLEKMPAKYTPRVEKPSLRVVQ